MQRFYTLFFTMCTFGLFAQTTYLVENFDYDQGDEIRFHGWYAHSAGGTNPILVSAEGLSMATTPYAGNAIGNAAWVINNGSDENKPFSSWIRQPEAGQPDVHVYASFLMKPFGPIPEATGNTRPYFFHYGEYQEIEDPEFNGLSTAFRARTFIYPGTLPNTFRMNLSFNENEPDPLNQTNNYNSDEVHLIVVKYTSIAGEENDLVSLYVFRDGDDISQEPATPTIGPLVGTNRDVVLQAVALRQYQDDQNVIVDGIIVRDYWDLTGSTSTEEITAQSPVQVYPNPAAGGELFLSFTPTTSMQVNIIDMQGRVMLKDVSGSNRLDISNLNAGNYIVHILHDNKLYYQKLVIH